MRNLVGIFLLVFGLVSATAVSADVSREDTRALLEQSGIAEKVRNADAILKTRLHEVLEEMPERVLRRWLDQMQEMFSSLIDPQKILELLERGLAEELSQSDLIALNAFYESPLARRIVAVESAASTPAAFERIEGSFDALEARRDRNPVREDLLGRLDQARRYSEIEAALAAASFVGFTHGVLTVVRKGPKISYDFQFSAFPVSFLDRFRYGGRAVHYSA